MTTRNKRTRQELADFVVGRLQSQGLDGRECSRFSQVRRVYDRAEGFIASDNPKFDEALEGERDLQTLGFVFDNLGPWSTSQEFQALLSLCVKDGLLPKIERGESKGRDAQFHLQLVATCQRAGLQPKLAEPDIVCRVDGADFGIAAKRIKNIDRLRDRINEAADQFKRARLAGVIAVDLTAALNRENLRPVAAGQADQFMAHVAKTMVQLVKPRMQDLRRRLDPTRVRGILFCNSFVVVGKTHEPEYLSHNLGVCTVISNPDRIIHFHRFRREFARGTYNPQNGLPKVPRRRDLIQKK